MKLISVDVARAIWLFPLSELNPGGRSTTKTFLDFTERYNFKKAPKHTLDFDSDSALTFDQGEFTNKKGLSVIVKCRMYSDGFVADSWSSTTDSREFLEDAMGWLKANHGLALPSDRLIKSMYLSELTVTTESKLLNLNPKFRTFADLLSGKAKEFRGDDTGFNVGSIGFWSNDPTRPRATAPFRFENKTGTLPQERRYWSQAPFPTDVHVELLEEFETILS